MAIIDTINERARALLEKDKSGQGYICPICSSGSGANGTGITTKDNLHFTCWRGCFSNASLLDIIALKNGVDPNNSIEAVKVACKELGISESSTGFTAGFTAGNNDKKAETSQKSPVIDFNKWPLATADETARTYLQFRAIRLELADKLNIRFCEDLYSVEAKKKIPAIIIPTGSSSYIARNIDAQEKSCRYIKSSGSYEQFNLQALKDSSKPVFIVEGEIDAITIIQAGAPAVALGGQAIEKVFNKALEAHFSNYLVVALDNDETGLRTTEKLKANIAKYEAKGLKLYFPDVANLFNDHKDANEAYKINDFYFEAQISDIQDEIDKQEEQLKQEALLELKRDSIANYRTDFDKAIEDSKTASYIPTGFNNLDQLLDGGLYSGLYVVGAISSLGKTTLCLQIADQIAQSQKKDILIFSLEMSKRELIAKSISRITSNLDVERTRSNTDAKTTRGILTGSRYKDYSERELQLINDAKEHYFNDIAPNIYIYEGMGNIGVAQVRARVEAYKKITGEAPIVLIDYLQLLQAPIDSRFNSDKQITDFNVMELKRISRDFNTSVIGISSFNRDNYTAPVNMASFKESGAIEYSSDVLIGLQYKAFSELKADGKDKAKADEIRADINNRAKEKRPIEIQLIVLKNRNGNKGQIDLDFYPMFNKFNEPLNKNSIV